jgi:uncharacterized membrane protein YvlD (DUF360 family)
MKSSFLSLNSKDFIKGLFVAVVSAVIALLYTSLQAGNLVIDWKAIGMAALSAALAYITKNLLTNSSDELLKKEVLASGLENPNT